MFPTDPTRPLNRGGLMMTTFDVGIAISIGDLSMMLHPDADECGRFTAWKRHVITTLYMLDWRTISLRGKPLQSGHKTPHHRPSPAAGNRFKHASRLRTRKQQQRPNTNGAPANGSRCNLKRRLLAGGNIRKQTPPKRSAARECWWGFFPNRNGISSKCALDASLFA